MKKHEKGDLVKGLHGFGEGRVGTVEETDDYGCLVVFPRGGRLYAKHSSFVPFEGESNDWIPWNGMPSTEALPSPDTIVIVKFRNGEVSETEYVRAWRWGHMHSDYDIVAYRVVGERGINKAQLQTLKEMPDEQINFSDIPELDVEKLANNKYLRSYPYGTIDIYRVLQVYEVTDPCLQHAIKKLLCAGKRGYKEVEKDIQEAQQCLTRWVEMRREEEK